MTGGAKDLALGAIRCAMRGDAGFLPGRCYAGRDWGWRYSEGLTPVQGGGGAAECALAGEAEQEGDGEEDVEDAAIAFLQRVVCDGERHAREQQDGGVDGRQTEGRYGLEAAIVARAEGLRRPGPYQLQAAIAAGHAQGSDPATLAAALRAHVKSELAPHKYPRWIEFVADLPKTATGKIQRFKLRQ